MLWPSLEYCWNHCRKLQGCQCLKLYDNFSLFFPKYIDGSVHIVDKNTLIRSALPYDIRLLTVFAIFLLEDFAKRILPETALDECFVEPFITLSWNNFRVYCILLQWIILYISIINKLHPTIWGKNTSKQSNTS